jgi:hypothetical protein
MAASSFVLFAKLDQFQDMETWCREACVMWGMSNVIQFCKERAQFGDTDLDPKLMLCHTTKCDEDEILSGVL